MPYETNRPVDKTSDSASSVHDLITKVHDEISSHLCANTARTADNGVSKNAEPTSGFLDIPALPGVGNKTDNSTNSPKNNASSGVGDSTTSPKSTHQSHRQEKTNPLVQTLGNSYFLASMASPTTDTTTEAINPSGVVQGQYGDCFFESSLSSLANSTSGQEQIRNMIKQNQDGSYTVTFPGDNKNPVSVTQDDLKQAGTVDAANWANVIETAFLKYDHAGTFATSPLDKLQSEKIPYLAPVTMDEQAMQLLTNKSTAADQFATFTAFDSQVGLGSTSKQNVASNLETALANGEPITANANDYFTKYFGDHDAAPLVTDHVYSVLSYDPKSETVVIRNPWGNNAGTPFADTGATADGITSLGDGKLSMSLDTFMGKFSTMSMAGTNPYVNNAQNVINDVKTTGSDIAQTGKDIWNGNFTAAQADAWQSLKDTGTTASEQIRNITDSAERAAKSTAATVWDGITTINTAEVNLGMKAADALKSGWQTVSSWL